MSSSLVPQALTGIAEPVARQPTDWTTQASRTRTRRRYAAERRFRLMGFAAVWLSVGFLAFLLASMLWQGASGFIATRIELPIALNLDITPDRLAGRGGDLALAGAGLEGAVDAAATAAYGAGGADLLSDGAWLRVRDAVKADPTLLHRQVTIDVPAAADIDVAAKGEGTSAAEAQVAKLAASGVLTRGLNLQFLTDADSTDSTRVGIWGAFQGIAVDHDGPRWRLPSRSASSRRFISRNMRHETAGPT